MFDVKTQPDSLKTEIPISKIVQVFLQSTLRVLAGYWQWDLHSDSIFCSDIMLYLPSAFPETKGIIYPDDITIVAKALDRLNEEATTDLQFRIITTYGEVRTLKGKGITLVETEEILHPEKVLAEQATGAMELQKELTTLHIQKKITRYAEQILQTGTWYSNTTTHETWYSDGVFRLFGLPPQSLNAHLNTFNPFLHPDDRDIVTETFLNAFSLEVPVHIEYRIVTADGNEKIIQHLTNWIYSQKGERIIAGILQDRTEQLALDHQLKQAGATLKFQQELLGHNEEFTGAANWHINLLTRKMAFGDNYYRLYGLKPQSVLPSINLFINYVHPDDRETVLEYHKKLRYEHTASPIEYRIIRTDGKIRHLLQRGKLILYSGEEQIMAGTVQDITHQKMLDEKLLQLNAELFLKNNIQLQAEEAAGVCSWHWDIKTGKMTCSDNMYRFFGVKPQSVELTKKFLLSFIDRDDQKIFTHELDLIAAGQPAATCELRMVRRGKISHIKAYFKYVQQPDAEMGIGIFWDITTEHELQTQLEEQANYQQRLTDTIHDKVIVTDVNNTILNWNKRCEESFGYKESEVQHKNIFDVFPQLKESTLFEHLQQVLQGETVFLSPAALPIKGYHHITISALTHAPNEVTGILYVMQDVEKQMAQQQTINERLPIIESLMQSATDRIIVMDRNMNYLYWNRQCEKQYGISKEEVIGKNILEVFPGSIMNDTSFNHFRKALKGETVHLPAIESGAGTLCQEVYLLPVKDGQGEVSAVVWVLRDLSGNYQLRVQQKETDELLSVLDKACIKLDAEGGIIYVNPEAEVFFKKTKEELLRTYFWEVYPEYKNTPLYEATITASENKTPLQTSCSFPGTNSKVYISIVSVMDGLLLLFSTNPSVKKE